MLTLLRDVSLRHLLEDRFKTLVGILGVALGIAVFLSIRLANGSVLGAFRSTVDVVSGKAELQAFRNPNGLPDDAYRIAKSVPGVRAVAPVIDATAVAPDWDGLAVTVLGIDLFSEPPFRDYRLSGAGDRGTALTFLTDPRAMAVSERLAEERGLKTGSTVRLLFGTRETTWRVVAVIQADEFSRAYSGRLAVVDIAAAQEAFGRIGRLDRLDILLDESAQVETVRESLSRALGPTATVARPRRRTEQVENLLAAFQLNLTALAAIAVFVGMFLIYNAMSISVVRRRREIGILRQIGVTRGQVLLLFLAEGSLYGLLGSAVGVVLGIILAEGALQSVAATVSALYVRVEAQQVTLSPSILLQSVALGFATSVLASLAPALEAAATPPGQTAREGSLAGKTGPVVRWLTAAGAVLLAGAGGLAWAAVAYQKPYAGFASAFAILGGFSLLSPAATDLFSRAARPAANRFFGAEGLLAAGYLSDALDRTSVVVAALMVSLSMFIGVSLMVASFRQTVVAWVDQTIRADVYVSPITWEVSGENATLPPRLVEGLKAVPGLVALDAYRAVPSSYREQRILLSAADFGALEQYGSLLFRGRSTRDVMRAALRNDGIIVTEGFALRFRKWEGDHIRLTTPNGEREFRIEGVYYDYTTSGPTVVMDRGLYRRLWNDDGVNSVAIYLKDPAAAPAARDWIERRFGADGGLSIVANREIHDQALRIFDQTFRVTYALEFISIAVAVLGIINTMTALILQRGRELGILRSIGATRAQLKKIILVESGLIGAAGFLVGAVSGTTLAMLLIYVINKQFFGWSIQVRWTPDVFVQAALITVTTSLLAGFLPAQAAAKRPVTEAIRME